MSDDHSVTIKYEYIGCVMKIVFVTHIRSKSNYYFQAGIILDQPAYLYRPI